MKFKGKIRVKLRGNLECGSAQPSLFIKKSLKKFPLAPMGVLTPVSAHAGPYAQPPIGTSGNFLLVDFNSLLQSL